MSADIIPFQPSEKLKKRKPWRAFRLPSTIATCKVYQGAEYAMIEIQLVMLADQSPPSERAALAHLIQSHAVIYTTFEEATPPG